MTIHQKLAAVFVVLACGNLAFHPDYFSTAISVIASVCLYGFTVLIERKENEKVVAIEKSVKDLDAKVQTLMIQRGLGR